MVLSTVLVTPASAADYTTCGSDYFGLHSAYIYDASGSQLQVWFDVTAVTTMDELGASVIKVQRSSDRSNWTTVQTYSKENYPNLIDTDTVSHGSHVTYYNAQSGYYYRAYIKYYAKKGENIAEYISYTSSVLW